MFRTDPDHDAIFASDGTVTQRLYWAVHDAQMCLMNAAGQAFAPWEITLLRWSSTEQMRLQQHGYLRAHQQPPEYPELWCNCAD